MWTRLARTLSSAAIAALLAALPRPAPAAPACANGTTPLDVVGAWAGSWSAAHSRGGGSVEMVVSAVGNQGRALGQFTFVAGAVSRTARYYGTLCGERLRFPLPDDGWIELSPEDGRLVGDFKGAGRVLPVAAGSLHLSRTP